MYMYMMSIMVVLANLKLLIGEQPHLHKKINLHLLEVHIFPKHILVKSNTEDNSCPDKFDQF